MSLSRTATAAVAVLFAAATASADDYWVYLGTYTRQGRQQGYLPREVRRRDRQAE